MKPSVIFLFVLLAVIGVQAQNPFEEFGYNGKVLTMTGGKFNEVHDMDSIVQIGSVFLNVNQNEIIAYAETDTTTFRPNPTLISRWWSIDPLAEKYYQLSPYNFVANNPILYTDPDGREVQVTFQDEAAKKMYSQLINKALGGQFQVTLTGVKGKDGVFNVGFEKTKDGGDISKLGKGAQSFFKEFSKFVDSKVVTSMEIVRDDKDVAVGNFGTSRMDVADVSQFPSFDPTKDEQDGPTDAGKVIHETAEQFQKANKQGVGTAHDRAISYENSTNGNTRGRDVVPGRDQGIIESFQRTNGSSVRFQILGGQYSEKRGTIILVPVTNKK